MSIQAAKDVIHSRIWQEEPEPDNPFAARIARCHGFDVYGAMVGNARWVELVYLLFRGEPPSEQAAQTLETLAVALANPGPRDPSVHAAMCSGTGGSPAAASLMAALAVGAGQLSGAREVRVAVARWIECGTSLDKWRHDLAKPVVPTTSSAWPASEHPPGFDPYGVSMTLPVKQTLDHLAGASQGAYLPWLKAHRSELEAYSKLPISMTGVAAAAYADLGLSPEQAEMLHLILRLPGAAAHALEQWEFGHKKFPFYENEFEPGSRECTAETGS